MKIPPPGFTALVFACACFLLQGCGGPKYSSDFKSWLGVELAKNEPLKLTGVSVEEIAASGGESVFSFIGSGETTDDLFNYSLPPFAEKLNQLQAKWPDLAVDVARKAGFDQLVGELQQMAPIPSIAEVTTKKGSVIKLQGKAKASIGDAGWAFAITQLQREGMIGQPRMQNTVVKGSAEEKALNEKLESLIARMEQAAEMAVRMQEEEERIAAAAAAARIKEEEEKAAQTKKQAEELRESVLAAFRNGCKFFINWQAQTAQGRMQATISEGTGMGDTFSAQGFLSEDSAEAGLTKPFYAMISGEGTEDSPVVVTIRVEATPGDSSWRDFPDSAKGFLAANSKYTYQLRRADSGNIFSGELTFSYSNKHGPRAPVKFAWQPVTP